MSAEQGKLNRKVGNKSPNASNGAGLPNPKSRNRPNGLNDKKIADDEFMAAAIGDVEWLRQSLRASKGSINYDQNGLAAIHLASIHGRMECLKLLVEKFKVDPNLPSTTGWRPIHLVISNQSGKRAFASLTYLLQKGADPSITNDDGITPMHQAASEGHVQCMKALVDAGAKIDRVDCRGHKPIDLAKLWGHRKCARLLAAELWHQDKEFVSSEMKQLQRLKMQQVLQEIKADEDQKLNRKFHDDIAFNNWLKNHNLQRCATGPPSAEKTREKTTAQQKEKPQSTQKPKKISKPLPEPEQKKREDRDDIKESTHKPNSMRAVPVRQPSPIMEESIQPASTKSQPGTPQDLPREASTASHPRTPYTRASDDSYDKALYEKAAAADDVESVDDVSLEETPGTTVYHLKQWNKSTKVPETFGAYMARLADHYPRDEYTMMPKYAPRRLTRSPTPLVFDEYGERDNDVISAGGERRMPKLPRDVINKTLDPGKYERSVVFKCKHIADTHKKRDIYQDRLPRSEIGMHLYDDLNSPFFKSSLSHQMPRSSTVSSRGSDKDPDTTGDGLAQLMQRMNKPNNFPNLKGKEYDLGFKQTAVRSNV